MSTEQATLDAVEVPSIDRSHSRVDRRARYGRTTNTVEQQPDDAGCCRTCGADVATVAGHQHTLVQRYYADEHGRVPACPECSESETFAAALGDAQFTEQTREITRLEAAERDRRSL